MNKFKINRTLLWTIAVGALCLLLLDLILNPSDPAQQWTAVNSEVEDLLNQKPDGQDLTSDVSQKENQDHHQEAPTKTSIININEASKSELETLPGIGPAKAEAIILYRDQNGGFQTVNELLQVKGIGKKTLAKLKDWVTIE